MLYILPFILYALYFGIFIFLISRWRFFDIALLGRNKLIAVFGLKAWAGLVITLVYTYYYTDPSKADIYRYFSDSKIISSVIFYNPAAWFKIITSFNVHSKEIIEYISNTLHYSHPESDFVTSNSFFIRIISLLNYFSLYNVYVDTLLLDFIGFLGLTALFKSLQPYFKGCWWALFIPVYLLPSVVFWSSGLLKESLLIPALGAYIFGALKLRENFSIGNLVILTLLLFTVACIKIFVFVFVLVCSPFLFYPNNGERTRLYSYWLIAFYVLLFVSGFYFRAEICSKIIDKRNEFVKLAINENAASTIDTSITYGDCGQIISISPSAIINAVLRPFLWERNNLFALLFALENSILLTGIIGLLVFFFKNPDVLRFGPAAFFLFFALLNYLLIGLTVPVMGAIVHYRVIAMPFLLLGILLLVDLNKLKTALTRFTLGLLQSSK